jgi:flagellar biosynthesis protein FliQ
MPLYVKLAHDALAAEFMGIAPIIAILLTVGIVTAIIQAVFQIEDAAFGLLPKTIAMIAIAVFGGFGALQVFENLATFWISHAGLIVHQSWS